MFFSMLDHGGLTTTRIHLHKSIQGERDSQSFKKLTFGKWKVTRRIWYNMKKKMMMMKKKKKDEEKKKRRKRRRKRRS